MITAHELKTLLKKRFTYLQEIIICSCLRACCFWVGNGCTTRNNHIYVVVWEHVVFELGMDVQLAPWIPCPRARMWIFPLRSNPGHKVTKKGPHLLTTWGDTYSSLSYQGPLSLFGTLHVELVCRNSTRVLTKPGRTEKGRKDWPSHPARIFVGQRRMVILCRPELVLFPTCCCVIIYMLRLVCCFRYSWCVTRLIRAGPRRDLPRRRPSRTKHPYHRLASFFSKSHNK